MKSLTIIIILCTLILILTFSIRYIIIDNIPISHSRFKENFTGYLSTLYHPSCNNNVDLYNTIELVSTMPKYVYDYSNTPSNNLDNFFIYSKPAQIDVNEIDIPYNKINNELEIHKNIFKKIIALNRDRDFPEFIIIFNSQYKVPLNFNLLISSQLNRLNIHNIDMIIFGNTNNLSTKESISYIISKKFVAQILEDLTISPSQTSQTSQISQTLISLLQEKYKNYKEIYFI